MPQPLAHGAHAQGDSAGRIRGPTGVLVLCLKLAMNCVYNAGLETGKSTAFVGAPRCVYNPGGVP